MSKYFILILLQISIFTEEAKYHNLIYSIFPKINISDKVLILSNTNNIKNYDFLVIKVPNKKINIKKLNKNKPTLVILNNKKKEIKLLISYLNYFNNIQFYVGNIFNLEIENNIEKIINDFIKDKKISKSYEFTQNKKIIKIKNNKNKLFYLISKNYFISKYCKDKCKLKNMTYIKYIFSNQKIYKNKINTKKINELEKLIKEKLYLKALLLLFELKYDKTYKKLNFKKLEEFLFKKAKLKEPFLKNNLENI